MLPTHEADYPPLMLCQIAALRAYAQANGPGWEQRLRTEWLNETVPPLLQRLRANQWLCSAGVFVQQPHATAGLH